MADKQRRVTWKDVRPAGRDVVALEWPGGGPFTLLLLRCDEVQEAHFAAVDRFMRKGQPIDGLSSINEFVREKELQEVFRMLLEPETNDPKRRLHASADAARTAMDLFDIAWAQKQHQLESERVMVERGLMEAAKETEGAGDDR